MHASSAGPIRLGPAGAGAEEAGERVQHGVDLLARGVRQPAAGAAERHDVQPDPQLGEQIHRGQLAAGPRGGDPRRDQADPVQHQPGEHRPVALSAPFGGDGQVDPALPQQAARRSTRRRPSGRSG